MSVLELTATLVCLTALLSLVNARYLKLPATIGVTLGGIVIATLLLLFARSGDQTAIDAVQTVRAVNFETVVFDGVLSFLLFAGALGVDTRQLWRMRVPVVAFALVSTLLSIFLVGFLVYGLLGLFGMNVSLAYCLLFGALISPTDPVAVLGMLKQAKVPSRIENLVAGESLFNDGIGVVAFSVLSAVAVGSADSEFNGFGDVFLFFIQEAGGGLLLGVTLGTAAYLALRSVSDFPTEVLVSLGLVLALTAIAESVHVSGPLAAVAAGLLVGQLTDRRPFALSSRQRFGDAWSLLDELLNIALFTLLGLELAVVEWHWGTVLIGVLTIPLVLLSRAISVNVPFMLLDPKEHFEPYTRSLMIWGGLRGAISVALAFTVPGSGEERQLFLVLTYAVVVFSIVVQGLTVSKVARKAANAQKESEASSS